MQGAGLLPAASEQPQAQIAATEQARAQMQQWARFPLYLTQDVWNILQGSSERQLRKVECVTSHLVTLGLRNPSERTMATVAAVIAQCDGQNMEDPDTAKQVALLSTVKSVMKTHIIRARQLGTPIGGGYLQELPVTWEQLPGEMRERFFPTGLVQPPIDLNIAWRSGNAWPMRSTHRSRQLQGGHTDLISSQAGYAAAIAQQAAVTTAQALLALVNPGAVGRCSEVQLPGFQQFQPGNREMPVSRRDESLRLMLEEANAAPAAASSSSVPAAPASMSQQLALTNGEPSQSVGAVATPAAPSAVQPAVDSQPEGSAAMEAAEAAQVEASLAILANAHYNETLPSVLSPPEEASACKRPAGKSAVSVKKIMKRPAAAAMLASSSEKRIYQKPAAASSSIGPKKRPAAKTDQEKKITRAKAYELRPTGCARCRHQRGCCPSCWKKKGMILVD